MRGFAFLLQKSRLVVDPRIRRRTMDTSEKKVDSLADIEKFMEGHFKEIEVYERRLRFINNLPAVKFLETPLVCNCGEAQISLEYQLEKSITLPRRSDNPFENPKWEDCTPEKLRETCNKILQDVREGGKWSIFVDLALRQKFWFPIPEELSARWERKEMRPGVFFFECPKCALCYTPSGIQRRLEMIEGKEEKFEPEMTLSIEIPA